MLSVERNPAIQRFNYANDIPKNLIIKESENRESEQNAPGVPPPAHRRKPKAAEDQPAAGCLREPRRTPRPSHAPRRLSVQNLNALDDIMLARRYQRRRPGSPGRSSPSPATPAGNARKRKGPHARPRGPNPPSPHCAGSTLRRSATTRADRCRRATSGPKP